MVNGSIRSRKNEFITCQMLLVRAFFSEFRVRVRVTGTEHRLRGSSHALLCAGFFLGYG